MARSRKLSPERKAFINSLIEHYHPEDTTNAIENFNRGLRKVTKAKSIFPNDDALFKSIYLAMIDITKKWTGAPWNWGQTLNQFCIYFGDRITPADLE